MADQFPTHDYTPEVRERAKALYQAHMRSQGYGGDDWDRLGSVQLSWLNRAVSTVPAGVPPVSQASDGSVTIATLRQHWLSAMECDHASSRDKPHCSCSLVDLGWHPSVGAAVEAWLAHVAGVEKIKGTTDGKA